MFITFPSNCMCKRFFNHFLFLYSFRNGTLFQCKKRQILVGKETWEVMKMASHLGTYNFCAIIVFTVTSQQNGSYLYIIS